MTLSCVAALSFGIVIGYILNWAIRHNPKPDAKEVAALIAAVAGGSVVTLIRGLIGCPNAMSWYLIGLAVGFFLYTVALWLRWEQIRNLVTQARLNGIPLFPWLY